MVYKIKFKELSRTTKLIVVGSWILGVEGYVSLLVGILGSDMLLVVLGCSAVIMALLILDGVDLNKTDIKLDLIMDKLGIKRED